MVKFEWSKINILSRFSWHWTGNDLRMTWKWTYQSMFIKPQRFNDSNHRLQLAHERTRQSWSPGKCPRCTQMSGNGFEKPLRKLLPNTLALLQHLGHHNYLIEMINTVITKNEFLPIVWNVYLVRKAVQTLPTKAWTWGDFFNQVAEWGIL